MADRLPTYFIPHGGGPCFFTPPPPACPRDTCDRMAGFLRGLAAAVGARPRAVLIVSGHREADRPTLNTHPAPPPLHDYNGFPEHTYRLSYPVPGELALAREVRALLADAGFATDADAPRGLDHGVFVPLMLVYPGADVPVLQLSLQRRLDPAEHLAIGRALAPLRADGVLIVGSGMSYHNLPDMMTGRGDEPAEAFDTWLNAAVTDPADRDASLTAWRDAPGALAAHPTPEHLLPLMVAAGAAAGEQATRVYADHVLGKAQSGFRFG